jgi:hypothetical protein
MKEALEVQGLDALLVAGRRLLEEKPEAFAKVLAVARAFIAVLDRPNEPIEIFLSRLQQIRTRGPKTFD